MFGLKKAIEKITGSDRQRLQAVPGFDHDPGMGHPALVEKMNRYFSEHPTEGKWFKEEMQFINELPARLQDPGLWEVYSVFPYPFVFAYDPMTVEVHMDEAVGMYYVLHNSRRLYYPRAYQSVTEIQKHYTNLSAEQDPLSPHNYFQRGREYAEDDIVADLGAAEGNFSLTVVDKVKALFIVESDRLWIEALFKTFEPWKDKVHIIQKAAGAMADEQTITLDDLLGMGKFTVVKMDIEGAEVGVLESSNLLSAAHPMDLMVAAHHRPSDAAHIRQILAHKGFQTSTTEGYMLFPWDRQTPPYFRKGMVFASNYHRPQL